MLVGLKNSAAFGAIVPAAVTDGNWLKAPALVKPVPKPPVATPTFESRELA
jgi:hypothetical protein